MQAMILLCATLIILAFLAAAVFLVIHGHPVFAIVCLILAASVTVKGRA